MKEDKKNFDGRGFLDRSRTCVWDDKKPEWNQKLDESGAVVMSGSLDADGNISWEKTALQKRRPAAGDSGSSTEKQELQGTIQG